MSTRLEELSHRRPRLRALLAVLLSGWIGVTLIGAEPAAAHTGMPAQGDGSRLTWSVRPTPTDTEQERPNFGFDLEAGETVTDSIRVRNYTSESLPLDLYASDAITTSNGALDLLPASEEPSDVGAWIALEMSELNVPAGDFVDVPFTLTVPADTEPGDHTGGIVTSYQAPGVDDEGEPVVLDRRLGSRVHVRVDGALRPQLEISGMDVSYSGTVNPVATGTLRVGYTVTNTGNVRVGADQVVSTSGLGLGRTVAGEPLGELLPGNSLTLAVEIADVWPTVRATARIELTPVPTRDGDAFDTAAAVAAGSASAWAVPWTLLVIVLVAIATPLLVRWRRRQRKRREVALVDEAVQAALANESGTTTSAGTTDTESGESSVAGDRTNPPAATEVHTVPDRGRNADVPG